METYCIHLGKIIVFFLINFCFVFQRCHSWQNKMTKDRASARFSGHNSAGPDHGLPPPAWSTDESHVRLTRVSHHCSCCTHPAPHLQHSPGMGRMGATHSSIQMFAEELHVDTLECFTGSPEKCGANTVTYSSNCAHLEWLERELPLPPHLSL